MKCPVTPVFIPHFNNGIISFPKNKYVMTDMLHLILFALSSNIVCAACNKLYFTCLAIPSITTIIFCSVLLGHYCEYGINPSLRMKWIIHAKVCNSYYFIMFDSVHLDQVWFYYVIILYVIPRHYQEVLPCVVAINFVRQENHAGVVWHSRYMWISIFP